MQWGLLEWAVDLGDRVRSSPSIANDGTIYVGCDDGHLYAVRPNGEIRWTYETEGQVVSSPALADDGTIYVGSMDDYLYAISPAGDLRWKYDAGSEVISSPSIGPDGTVYVGSKDGVWHALAPNGDLKWDLVTDGYFTHVSAPVGDDGTVYMQEEDGHWLFAMTADGIEKWRTHIWGIIRWSPAVTKDGTVLVVTLVDRENSRLYAIGPEGELAWTFNTTGLLSSAPAVDKNGMIYVGTTDGQFFGILSDGTVAWSLEDFDHFTHSAPSIDRDGTIFAGMRNGGLYSLMETSANQEVLTNDSIWSSPAIGSNGRVYFGSNDGHLYSLMIPGPDGDPSTISVSADGSIPAIMWIILASVVIILIVLGLVFGLYYRGSGAPRADGAFPPHEGRYPEGAMGHDQTGMNYPSEYQDRPPPRPPD